eukprot:CAMPEP_0172395940 /NCGR_PEP_ID=MMETSP1061-20121228/22669_1 /TAXON_ID=37318 /ORGANISM="Pseudo-nitzschia pungens, Strain cf. pungens" /LENGTH=302 /DNA_ID=CAMNT_0013127677 /DNA_START=1 /DNA_END=909 /DNA_ORIENTATION=+
MKQKIFVNSLFTLLLATTCVSAKSYGSSGGGFKGSSSTGSKWGSSGSSSSTGSTWGSSGSGSSTGSKWGSSGSIGGYGGGYATQKGYQNGNYGQYGKYPNGGYGTGFNKGFFLYNGYNHHNRYRHHNNHKDDDDEFEDYFDRVVDGCEIFGVDSYRTIDNSLSADSEWQGCSEEWEYSVRVRGNESDISFVSPPLEFYACDEFVACGQCEDSLRGTDFNALGQEDFEFNKTTYLVDCYVPKNRTLVEEDFNCTNDECIFLSEKLASSSSSSSSSTAAMATTALYWTTVVSSGIVVSIFSLFA